MRKTFIYMRRHTKKRKQKIKIRRTPAYKLYNRSGIKLHITAPFNRSCWPGLDLDFESLVLLSDVDWDLMVDFVLTVFVGADPFGGGGC